MTPKTAAGTDPLRSALERLLPVAEAGYAWQESEGFPNVESDDAIIAARAVLAAPPPLDWCRFGLVGCRCGTLHDEAAAYAEDAGVEKDQGPGKRGLFK